MLKHYLDLPRPVYILCLGTLINRAGSFLLPFLTTYLTVELGFETGFATMAMGAFGLGSIVAALVGGSLADRIGRRTVMLLSLFGAAGILLAFGFLSSKWMILSAVVALALFADMYRPAASAMIADLVSAEQRTHAFGLMYLAINLGFCIAAVIGGVVAKHSFFALFVADSATAAIYAVIILLVIRETLPGRVDSGPIQRDAESAGIVEGPDAQVDSPIRSTSAYLNILRNYAFLIFCLAGMLIGILFMQCFSTFPIYLQQQGIGPDDYGRIVSVNGLLIVLLQIPITAWVARYPRGLIMVLGSCVIAVGFGATHFAATPWQYALTIVIWTIGEIMQAPLMSTIVAKLAPTEFRARYMGVFSMSFAASHVIAAPLGGLVLTHLGPKSLWAGSFGVGLLAAGLYLAISRSINDRGTQDRSSRLTPVGSDADRTPS